MAIPETKPIKQLRELLQQKQEPFVLETYLVERGHLSESSRKSLNRSGGCHLKKNKKGTPQYYNAFRTVYKQVVSINERLRVKKSNLRNESFKMEEQDQNKHQEAEFSFASSTTVFNSCPESDAKETSTILKKDEISFIANTSQSFKPSHQLENEVVTDTKLRWQRIQENKKHSSLSALEHKPSHGVSPVYNNNSGDFNTKEEDPSKTYVFSPKKVTEGSILSASLWKIFFQYSSTEKPTCTAVTEEQEPVQSNVSLRHFKSKLVLQQTRQLLFDYIREVFHIQGRKEKQRQRDYNKHLKSEEAGKLIGKTIRSWDKLSGDESNMKLDLIDSPGEWNCYEPHQKGIGLEIGNNILDDIIEEIVLEIIGFLPSITCSSSKSR